MNWNEMTYEEQRALLGLPDVRTDVAWMRLRLRVASIRRAMDRITGAAVAADYALAQGGVR